MDTDDRAKIYVELWKSENQIKTQKLMAYLIVQPLIALGASKEESIAFYFFSILGILLSVWWIFCIGRTVGYQKLWKQKLAELNIALFPTEEEKHKLAWYAKVPAKVILLAPPFIGAIVWLVVLVFGIARRW